MTAVDLTRDVDLAPGSPAWTRLVTASKVPAILGVSPWSSPFQTWHRMKGHLPPDETTSTKERGTHLEPGVFTWWLDQHPDVTWRARGLRRWLPGGRWGMATLDALAREGDDLVIVEVKTTTVRDEWGTPGTDEVPAHVLAQVLWQLACTPNAVRAYVAVLHPFLEFAQYVIDRDVHAENIAATVRACQAFHASLAADVPPPLDNHVATVETLRALHPDVEPGLVAVVDVATASEYVAADLAVKAAEKRLTAAKAAILDAAGNAASITTQDGQQVARRQPAGRGVSLRRTATTLAHLEAVPS